MKNKLFVRRKTENYIEPVINDGKWPEEIQSILKPGMMIDPKSSCVWTIKGGCPKNLIARKGDLIVRDGEDIKGYENGQALLKDYKVVHLFGKEDRSSFKYWFAHWCAFNMTALNLGIWRPRFLFHDWMKPWLKLFWPYPKVQTYHRTHAKHHLQYGIKHGWDKLDVSALITDWECSRFTKVAQPLDARNTLEKECSKEEIKPYEEAVRKLIEPKLNALGL